MKIVSEKCQKCGSDKTRTINLSYPKAYECLKCMHVFIKSPKALIDE